MCFDLLGARKGVVNRQQIRTNNTMLLLPFKHFQNRQNQLMFAAPPCANLATAAGSVCGWKLIKRPYLSTPLRQQQLFKAFEDFATSTSRYEWTDAPTATLGKGCLHLGLDKVKVIWNCGKIECLVRPLQPSGNNARRTCQYGLLFHYLCNILRPHMVEKIWHRNREQCPQCSTSRARWGNNMKPEEPIKCWSEESEGLIQICLGEGTEFSPPMLARSCSGPFLTRAGPIPTPKNRDQFFSKVFIHKESILFKRIMTRSHSWLGWEESWIRLLECFLSSKWIDSFAGIAVYDSCFWGSVPALFLTSDGQQRRSCSVKRTERRWQERRKRSRALESLPAC